MVGLPIIHGKQFDNPYDYLNLNNKGLEEFLNILSDVYYNTDQQLVSDEIFDDLRDELFKRNPKSKFFSQVGHKNTDTNLKNVILPYKMFSLDKIKPAGGEFEKWIDKYTGPYTLSDKLDGISAMIINNNGKFNMYLRSTSDEGTDVTHILKYIQVNLSNIPNNYAIRGELITSRANFEKIKEKYNKARMFVNGAIKRKTPEPQLLKLIEFIAFSIVFPRLKQSKQYKTLSSELKLKTVPFTKRKSISVDYMLKYFEQRRANSLYDIDGVVIADNSKIYDNPVSKKPEFMIAFKALYKEQYELTEIINVEWNISRLGFLKPKVQIKPIKILDSEINYATAHNAKFVVDNNLGPGAIVKIALSGDIIPIILEVMVKAKKPQMPQENYVWATASGVDIKLNKLSRDNKQSIIIKQLAYTMKTLKVEYFGEKLIERLVIDGKCNSLIDIINIDENKLKEHIGDNMGIKIYNNLINSLGSTDLPTLMVASNCFDKGIGIKRIKLVLQNIPDIMTHKFRDTQLYDIIININSFSEITTNLFLSGFECFLNFIVELMKEQNKVNLSYLFTKSKKLNTITKDNIFKNKKIVLTGFRDQKIQDFVEESGGSILSSVSKNTYLLIIKDNKSVESNAKYIMAKKLNIDIITKDEFYKRYLHP